jgi:TNF receptor-associated factor 4
MKAHVGDKVLSDDNMIRSAQTKDTVEQRMLKLEEKINELAASKPQPLGQPQQSDGRITGTIKPIGAEFVMTNFDEYKRDNDSWYSPHFYTHPNGYKMCLRVFANGNGSGQGTHISVFVYLMQGEFDNQLKWPFQGNITVKLVDQEEDRDHVIETFYSGNASERCERVMTRQRIENGWGIGQFLSHAELQPKYLKNNCIKLCVKKIDLY